MLVLIPMDSTDVQEAEITLIEDVEVWAQVNIEEGEIVEVLHSEKFDGFKDFSEAVVVRNQKEPVQDCLDYNMTVLIAISQRDIDEIVEGFLFRELHELNF